MALELPKKPQRRGLLHFVRGLWQRPPNKVPPEAVPLVSFPERANPAYLVPPGSDRRFAPKDRLQRLAPFAAEPYLAAESNVHHKQKGNAVISELVAYAARLGRAPGDIDQPNPSALLHDLLRLHPEIDNKAAADWEATRPNKEVIPPFQLDAATVQRVKFTRFLIQRGIYNEGFADGEIPPQYRTLDDYTKGDRADK